MSGKLFFCIAFCRLLQTQKSDEMQDMPAEEKLWPFPFLDCQSDQKCQDKQKNK
jgi:hypothetical protein